MASDNREVALPALLPELVADDHGADVVRANVLPRGERTARQERNAQQWDEIVRGGASRDAFHLITVGQIRVDSVDRGDVFEHVGSRAKGEELLAGNSRIPGVPWRVRPEEHQPIGITVRKWLQQHRPYDSEDRGAGADAQGHHRQCSCCVRRITCEDPQTVADIAKHDHPGRL